MYATTHFYCFKSLYYQETRAFFFYFRVIKLGNEPHCFGLFNLKVRQTKGVFFLYITIHLSPVGLVFNIHTKDYF